MGRGCVFVDMTLSCLRVTQIPFTKIERDTNERHLRCLRAFYCIVINVRMSIRAIFFLAITLTDRDEIIALFQYISKYD